MQPLCRLLDWRSRFLANLDEKVIDQAGDVGGVASIRRGTFEWKRLDLRGKRRGEIPQRVEGIERGHGAEDGMPAPICVIEQ